MIIILLVIATLSSKNNESNEQNRQLIFIGIDGINVDEFNKLLYQDKLQNFKKIIDNGGVNTEALITGHENTTTAPGNAELHTGLPSEITQIFNNECGKIIPKGKTTFERLSKYDSDINLGSIYGKNACYLSKSILNNAKKIIDWWQDGDTYNQERYMGKCTNNIDVAKKSLEFINEYKNDSYYLFVYFGTPDCAGHFYGTPSEGYTDSIVNADKALGIILENVKKETQIIISSDHGWNMGTKEHSNTTDSTRRIILISNNSNLIAKREDYKQCDIAPTILNYFGIKKEDYKDIESFGCSSLSKNNLN